MAREVCCACGVEFHVPQAFQNACKADSKKAFYCPNGHSLSYTVSVADTLRRERDQLKQDAARLHQMIQEEADAKEAARRQAAAYKGVATRMKNRVRHGVCPCCNRTFSDLARHMASKHPDIDNVINLKTA